MSPAEAAREILRRRAARSNLLDFTTYTFAGYKVGWHHRVVARALDAWTRHEIRRLMIFMPPRRGKSELASVRLPPFIFGGDPDAQVMAASYNVDLAHKMSRMTQRVIDSPEYRALFPNTCLFGANVRTLGQEGTWLRNSDEFEIVGRRGAYKCSGIGGGMTGRGFTHGIIDDPVKDRKEADSETWRASVWDWYTNVFFTRQAPGASILLMMTRWHEDDLAGRLIAEAAEKGDRWHVIVFPEEASQDVFARFAAMKGITLIGRDADTRETGGLLWPEMFGYEETQAIRAVPRVWSSLYQQVPTAGSGMMFKREWFEVVPMAPTTNVIGRVRFWDLAASTSDDAKRTAGLRMLRQADDTFTIENVTKGQWNPADRDDVVKQTAMSDGFAYPIRIEQEPGSGGIAQIDYLIRKLLGYNVSPEKVSGDKEVRAGPVASYAKSRRIRVVAGDWNSDFFDELESFPLGKYKDQVDALSGAFNVLAPPQIFDTPLESVERRPTPLDEMVPRHNPFEELTR